MINSVSYSDSYKSPTPEQSRAATTIQKFFRGHLTRNTNSPRLEASQVSDMKAPSPNKALLQEASTAILPSPRFDIIPKKDESLYIDIALKIDQLSFSEPYTKELMMAFLEKDDSWLGFAKDDSNNPIGYSISCQDGDYARVLSSIAVLPEHRGKGVGKACLQSFLDDAKNRRCTMAHLSVDKPNTTARSLYTKFGFVKIGSSDTQDHMTKALIPYGELQLDYYLKQQALNPPETGT